MPKKQYFLVLDVETANSTTDALVYDLGYAVVDRQGTIYASESLVISDIFYDEASLMTSAYYAEKIPSYIQGIKDRAFSVVSFYEARRRIVNAISEWHVSAVVAYNANFDVTALNTTERWLTKSKYRYFLPYGIPVYCIWHMACQLICTQKRYVRFCLENGFVSASGNIQTSAEVVFAYMTKNADYAECHTGFQDVLIEAQIMKKCFDQHKPFKKNINRLCWRIPQKQAKEMRVN